MLDSQRFGLIPSSLLGRTDRVSRCLRERKRKKRILNIWVFFFFLHLFREGERACKILKEKRRRRESIEDFLSFCVEYGIQLGHQTDALVGQWLSLHLRLKSFQRSAVLFCRGIPKNSQCIWANVSLRRKRPNSLRLQCYNRDITSSSLSHANLLAEKFYLAPHFTPFAY